MARGPAAARAPASGGSRATLVGRARELDVLRGDLGAGRARAVPHLVTVFGPAGIGKTRLAHEFARVVEELGGRSVRGRSLPYRESSAYFAFSTQVKQLCGIFESDTPEVGAREARASERRRGRARSPATSRSCSASTREGSVDDREELFFSVRVLHRVGRARPADGARLRGHPLGRPRPARPDRAAGGAAARPADHAADPGPARAARHPARAGAGACPATPRCRWRRSSADEARELAAKRLGELGSRAAARLAETAEGNPLFIEQLAADDGRGGRNAGRRCRRRSAASSPPGSTRCRDAERALLLDAAVVGKTFWRGALERIGRRQRRPLATLLGALERRDLIVRETRSSIEGRAAVQLQARADPRRRLRAAAAGRRRRAARARRRVLRGRRPPSWARRAAATARHWRDAGDAERGRSATSSRRASRPSAAGRRTRPRSSTARRSTSCPRTRRAARRRCVGGSHLRELPPSISRTRGS